MELIVGAMVVLIATIALLAIWIVALKHENSFQKVLLEMQNKVLIELREGLEEATNLAIKVQEQSTHLEEVEIAVKPKRPRGRPR